MISFYLDITLGALLGITIIFAWRLNSRIGRLQADRKEFVVALNEFNQSISKAEEHIGALKHLSQEADNQLVEHINKARFVANDLSFLMDKGENVADSLEHYIASSRRADYSSEKAKSSPALGPSRLVSKRSVEQRTQSASPNQKQHLVKELLDQIAHYKKKRPVAEKTPQKQAASPKKAAPQKPQAPQPLQPATATDDFAKMPASPSRAQQALQQLRQQQSHSAQQHQVIDT